MNSRSLVGSLIFGATAAAIVAILRRDPAVGSATSRRRFARRNGAFLRQLPRIRKLARAAIDRELSAGPTADRLIHLLARRAVDDFEEICVLAANGFGFGALSLLRGMYERVVTMFHLHQNPDDADQFADYHWVQRRKLAKAIGSSSEKPLTDELLADLERKYAAVKDQYITEICGKCGAKGVNFRWHKLDFVSMAKKTNVEAIKDLLVRAYYVPLEHAHSTADSLLFQIEERDGKPVFRPEQDSLYADHAVAVAHLLLLLAVACLRMQLRVDDLQPEIDRCARDHREAWPHL